MFLLTHLVEVPLDNQVENANLGKLAKVALGKQLVKRLSASGSQTAQSRLSRQPSRSRQVVHKSPLGKQFAKCLSASRATDQLVWMFGLLWPHSNSRSQDGGRSRRKQIRRAAIPLLNIGTYYLFAGRPSDVGQDQETGA